MARSKKTRKDQKESDFSGKLKSLLEQEKSRIQPKIDEEDKRKKRQRAVDEAHWRLLASQKNDFENVRAAGVILKWVVDFTASENFNILKEVSILRQKERPYSIISDALVWISTTISNQMLFIAVEGVKLSVANNVQYGRSHKLGSVTEILEHVKPEVIREVAKTIENGDIEDVILVENS